MPKDPLRLLCAELLRLQALDFLCFHELAHLGYGHIGYLEAAGGVPFLQELAPSIAFPDQGVTRQALEMSADAFAASMSLTGFLGSRDLLIRQMPQLESLIKEQKKAILLWAFAVASLFYVFGLTFDVNSLESGNYLPASIRVEGNIKCGQDAAAEAYPSLKQLFETHTLSLGHVAKAFECVGTRQLNEMLSEYHKARSDPRLDQHVQKVIPRFAALKPQLKAYSRFDLDKGTPPPAQ
jgi:hypothetical protein